MTALLSKFLALASVLIFKFEKAKNSMGENKEG